MREPKTDISILVIAKYLLKKEGYISLVQTIKLCYIAYGYVAGIYKEKLFKEKIYAFQYGPAINELYEKLKERNKHVHKIPKIADAFLVDELSLDEDVEDKELEKIKPKHKEVLDFIYSRYSHLSGMTLSEFTHQRGTPWRDCVGKDKSISEIKIEKGKEKEIPYKSIEKYFSEWLGVES